MSRFREGKIRFAALCAQEEWKMALAAEMADGAAARRSLNPLLSLLHRPELRLRAAYGLGLAVSRLEKEDHARVLVRRLLWSLNEESGNLGWGAPEAMGAILAQSPALAAEYGRIFLSYGRETGREDNFLEHPPLRQGLYQGMGLLARANAAAVRPALPDLVQALGEDNRALKGMAAFALEQLARAVPDADFLPGDASGSGDGVRSGREDWLSAAAALDRAAKAENALPCPPELLEVFDGEQEKRVSVAEMLALAAAAVRRRLGPEITGNAGESADVFSCGA
jgi:hypothetical protein